MLTDFVASSPKGKRDGSQGVGAKRKPLERSNPFGIMAAIVPTTDPLVPVNPKFQISDFKAF
jgi:hypothetical protein